MRLDPATAAVKIHGGRRWSGSGYWAANGLTGGLGNGLTGGLVDFFLFFVLPINRGGHSKVLDSINRLTETGRITASVI
jgi:hypothetical protein